MRTAYRIFSVKFLVILCVSVVLIIGKAQHSFCVACVWFGEDLEGSGAEIVGVLSGIALWEN